MFETPAGKRGSSGDELTAVMVKLIAFANIAVKNMADIIPLCLNDFFVIFDSGQQHTDLKK